MKYLSLDGVTYLWSKIKSAFIKKSDALSYEEIEASTDLTNKVPSASALKTQIVKIRPLETFYDKAWNYGTTQEVTIDVSKFNNYYGHYAFIITTYDLKKSYFDSFVTAGNGTYTNNFAKYVYSESKKTITIQIPAAGYYLIFGMYLGAYA